MSEGSTAPAVDFTCLHCGYDLRMLQSERCPECGQVASRDMSQISRIPWAHRNIVGRVRGYWRTVWLVTLSTRRLADELRRPIDFTSARRFWLLSATLAALPLMTGYVLFWIDTGRLKLIPPAYQPYHGWSSFSSESKAFYFDLQLPWFLGIHFSPIILVLIWITVATHLGLATYFVDLPGLDATTRSRAISLAYYTSGCITWSPATSFLGAIAAVIAYGSAHGHPGFDAPIAIIACGLGAVGALLLHGWRIIRLRRKVAEQSVLRFIATVVFFPVICALNVALLLGLVPWLLGYAWVLLRAG